MRRLAASGAALSFPATQPLTKEKTMAYGGEAAAAAAAVANAIKASGAIVRIDPEDFVTIVHRIEAPLVVTATSGFFRVHHRYLTSYKGLVFFAKSREPLALPDDAEIVIAGTIWMPS
jgi:hypothetical protein